MGLCCVIAGKLFTVFFRHIVKDFPDFAVLFALVPDERSIEFV